MDVPGKFLAIGILFYKDSLVSPLKQMTGPPPPGIEITGVGAVDDGVGRAVNSWGELGAVPDAPGILQPPPMTTTVDRKKIPLQIW